MTRLLALAATMQAALTTAAADWTQWLGDSGEFVGMTGFGASAPADVLYREFGITAEAVARAAMNCLARSKVAAIHL